MSKILQCLGWRKKKHKIYDKQSPHRRHIYHGEQPEINKVNRNEYEDRQSRLYTSGLDARVQNDERKTKSYPVSPVKRSSSGKRYLSDPKLEGFPIHNPDSIPVYVTSVTNNSPMRKSNEPFPFQVPPVDLPRRSSMFYGVKYDKDMFDGAEPKGKKYPAEKPIEEYYNIPSTSKENHLSHIHWDPNAKEAKTDSGRRVTITSPIEISGLEDNPNYQKHETHRKTVVRFRPHSSGNYNPSETVKQMTLRVEHDPSSSRSHVRDLPFKHNKESPILTTADGRPLVPLEKDKITRRSMLQEPRASVFDRNVDNGPRKSFRESILHEPHRESQAYTCPQKESAVYEEHPRESINRRSVAYVKAYREPSKRGSIDQFSPPKVDMQEAAPRHKETTVHKEPDVLNRKSFEQHRTSILHQFAPRMSHAERRPNSVESEDTELSPDENFPFAQEDQKVYAVPLIPTRGRSRSILQQSVKSLISKNQDEAPAVHRKNIRYSMDTDVFATNVRRRSVQQAPPGFVNMERGQPVLVSDVLNPITTLFVTDLKDPIPKDPLTRPKEANVWVKPRQVSETPRPPSGMNGQRQSISRQRTMPQSPNRYTTKPRRNYRPSQYEEDSDSDDSYDYRKTSRRFVQKQPRYQHQVYAANIPEVRFPVVETSKNPPFKKKGKPSQDFCGISADTPTKECSSAGVTNTPNDKQNDTDDEMDLLCYPSEKFLKNTVMAAESGSKLRWKIIIKRGEEPVRK